MAITRVDHIGIAVESIDDALPFYEALGLRVAEIEDVPQEGVRVALIPCGDTRIELLEPTSSDSAVRRFLDKRGPGLHHICLGSSDVATADAQLREAGYRMLRDEPTPGAAGSLIQFVHPASTRGVLVELAQPSPEAELEADVLDEKGG